MESTGNIDLTSIPTLQLPINTLTFFIQRRATNIEQHQHNTSNIILHYHRATPTQHLKCKCNFALSLITHFICILLV